MPDPRTLSLAINKHVILHDAPVYQVHYPRLPSDHLVLELSLTPQVLQPVPLFVELWDTQHAVAWGLYWSDQVEPERTTGCLHGLALTYYPQALLQLVLHTLPASDEDSWPFSPYRPRCTLCAAVPLVWVWARVVHGMAIGIGLCRGYRRQDPEHQYVDALLHQRYDPARWALDGDVQPWEDPDDRAW